MSHNGHQLTKSRCGESAALWAFQSHGCYRNQMTFIIITNNPENRPHSWLKLSSDTSRGGTKVKILFWFSPNSRYHLVRPWNQSILLWSVIVLSNAEICLKFHTHNFVTSKAIKVVHRFVWNLSCGKGMTPRMNSVLDVIWNNFKQIFKPEVSANWLDLRALLSRFTHGKVNLFMYSDMHSNVAPSKVQHLKNSLTAFEQWVNHCSYFPSSSIHDLLSAT